MKGQVHHIAKVDSVDIVMVEYHDVNARPERTRRFVLEAIDAKRNVIKFLRNDGRWQDLTSPAGDTGHGVIVWETVADDAVATRLATYLWKVDPHGPVGKVVLDWISKRGWTVPTKFQFATP